MKNRILLKEIPYGKFHSAIFTTYSINLYYLEQQVLPLLGSKGIHYISVLSDSNMLSAQLDTYSFLSEQKKRNYAINGIQCNGAFHPKIIFLIGETTMLLLIGSGNLTSSGHGKNLEVWNAIYVENESDKKLGLVIQAWNYLKDIHSDLGLSAQYKLKSIEENCSLLSGIDNVKISDSYKIDNDLEISFLGASGNNSIYGQLSDLIGNETITGITVMSPYYDLEGMFLHKLNKRFKPKEIKVILQENFGAIPIDMKPAVNMQFFYWPYIQRERVKQDYFHAKNIVFEGTKCNFLLSGSANASMAAFGSENDSIVNKEACVLYRSRNHDFVKSLGLNLNKGRIVLTDLEQTLSYSENNCANVQGITFIKTVEKSNDNFTFYLLAKKQVSGATIYLMDSHGEILFSYNTDIDKGISTIQFDTQHGLFPLYGKICCNSKAISNKQFVIDINAFESTNPSTKNRSLNQIRKLIEGGNFSTHKIIEYLNTIYNQQTLKKIPVSIGSKSDGVNSADSIIEEESDLLYIGYDEIQEKIKQLDQTRKGKGYTEYKSVRLWESIFSYLKDSKEREEQSTIDEEETEDINKSSGRVVETKQKINKPISKSNFDRLKDKVKKFLIDYLTIIETKIDNLEADKPTLIDLSMFLIILEILLHLLSHKEKIDDGLKEEPLLRISFAHNDITWSEFVLQSIGLFSLWCTQKNGFKEFDSDEYKLKLLLYKKMALKTSISALSLFSAVNKGYSKQKIENWKKLSLLNANIAFNTDFWTFRDIDEFLLLVPKETRAEIGEANFEEELNECVRIISSGEISAKFYLHPHDGFTYIEKETVNQINTSRRFLKLFNTGYEWDDEIENFWNGKLYSVSESKWFSSRKD